jgi:ribosomal protein L31
VRWDIDFTRAASDNVSLLQTQSIQNSNVPIAGNWRATCSSDTSALQSIVSTWVSQAAAWTTLNPYLIVNVANEWGPANSTVWRDSYISAIASLRAAGYTGPILVDSGGCGQDEADEAQYAQAVFQSDPERNIIFSQHLYGGVNDYSASIQSIQKGNPTLITLSSTSATHPFSPSYTGSGSTYSGISAFSISGVQGMTQVNGEQPSATNIGGSSGAWTITLNVDSSNWPDYTGGGTLVDYNGNYALRLSRMAAMEQSTGAVFIVGEFGPGNNIGPSPTTVTAAEIITAAEANNIGWLPWAWDDNNLAAGASSNSWFSMTLQGPGIYNSAADLTTYGRDVVLNPTYGITALAKPASIFTAD